MQKFTFSVADESPCSFCTVPVLLEDPICSHCGKKPYPRFTAADIYQCFITGIVIDARAGGLVLGRDSNEDDIPLITPVAQGIFQVIGLMQGGEYLVNSIATALNKARLAEINSYKSSTYNPMSSINLTDGSRVFNTNGASDNSSLLIDSESYVINRAATAKHFDELEKLNRKCG